MGAPNWRCAALLAFALIGPVGLPAGGADRRQPAVKRRMAFSEPVLLSRQVHLYGATSEAAPCLRSVEPGEPMTVIRSWVSAMGERWVQVRLASDLLAIGASRGWLKTEP